MPTQRNQCHSCKRVKNKGRWIICRETSKRTNHHNTYLTHTTFVSNRQTKSIINQEKIFECQDCFNKKNPIFESNMKFLASTPLQDVFEEFDEINKNFQNEQQKTNERVNNLEEKDKKIKEEEIRKTKEKRDELLDLDRKKWRRKLREHEKDWVNEAKSLEQLEKVEEKLTEVTKWNIYDFDGVEHFLGWPIFLLLVGGYCYWVRKENKKEVESEKFIDDIKDKFVKWRLNLISSVGVYIVLFFLSQQAINRWGYLVSNRVSTSPNWTILGVTILLGVIYIADNFITSILKTPLQRLGVKIENSPLQEKVKKSLLSKTQEVSESFKETFKRFGIVAITPLLIGLVGEKIWKKNIIANVCFLIPIAYAVVRIIEVSRILKKVEKGKIKLD